MSKWGAFILYFLDMTFCRGVRYAICKNLIRFPIELAAGLAQKLIEASTRRVQRAFMGDERQQALQASIAEGLKRSLRSFSLSKAENDHLDTILTDFFQCPEVIDELAQLLEPHPETNLDKDMLLKKFCDAGYDPRGLPGFAFEEFIACFVREFYNAAAHQKDLLGAMEIGLLSGIS